MRKAVIASVLVAAAATLVVATSATGAASSAAAIPGCAKGSLIFHGRPFVSPPANQGG